VNILVTGGAGFIGRHLVRELAREGHAVCVLDALVAQVHGPDAPDPELPAGVTFMRADVGDVDAWRAALEGAEAVIHLAAEVGVGQSMYEINRYMNANTMGTSRLLQVLAERRHPLRRLVVASSMSLYGEGAYRCPNCGPVAPPPRSRTQMAAHRWELVCARCGAELAPAPTLETKPVTPTSVYAISKRDQEELCLVVGRAYGIPTVALRFFNVFGPGQALSNPYTGVAAIFSSRLLNGKPPLVFEDGGQRRDFVHVSDVVTAITQSLTEDAAVGHAINIGSGCPRTVLDIARTLATALDLDMAPQMAGQGREGDIRHCYADITLARSLLSYEPRARFETCMLELAQWVQAQTAEDNVEGARAELERRGLAQ